MNAFDSHASANLGGPSWLASRRRDAYERFASSSAPSESEEIWRYSGINSFDLDKFAPSPPTSESALQSAAFISAARMLADGLGARGALVVTVNGSVVEIELSDPSGGIAVSSVEAAGDGSRQLGELAPARDLFGELHDAFLPDAVCVSVVDKAVLKDPIVIVHLTDSSQAPGRTFTSACPHTAVRLGTSSEAGVIEILACLGSQGSQIPSLQPSRDPSISGIPDGGGNEMLAETLVLPVTELDVGDDARLSYANLQVLDAGSTSIMTQSSRVGRQATLRSFTLGLGGRYSRIRTDSDLVGEGGTTALLAAYLGTSDQVHDFRTLQDHHAPRTESELLFQGAVSDTSRSVYSGLIRIRRGARGANAFQTNRNLVLSLGAHAHSVPNLDIDENDVRCSHASTVGPIDDEQLYYLESRGIEPQVAERLIVSGFFSDIAHRAPFKGVRGWVEDAVTQRVVRKMLKEASDA